VATTASSSSSTARANRDKERKPPTRSITGGDDLRIAAREQLTERRSPPARAKSADGDLLVMDLGQRNGDESKYLDEREARRQVREDRPQRSKSTDLSTRLRERREARAAERTGNNEPAANTRAETTTDSAA
jgi:hypothetical protein